MLLMAIVVIILAVVLIMVIKRMNKLITDAQQMEEYYKLENRNLKEDLEDSKYENSELHKQLENAQKAAKDAEKRCEELIQKKTFPMGPAGWNVVFEGKDNKK